MHATDDECPGELDEVKTSSPVVKRPSVTPSTGNARHIDAGDAHLHKSFDEGRGEVRPRVRHFGRRRAREAARAANTEVGEPVSPRGPGGDRQTQGHDLAARLLSPWSCFGDFPRCRGGARSRGAHRAVGRADGVHPVAHSPALINRRCPREKGGWECVADGLTIVVGSGRQWGTWAPPERRQWRGYMRVTAGVNGCLPCRAASLSPQTARNNRWGHAPGRSQGCLYS